MRSKRRAALLIQVVMSNKMNKIFILLTVLLLVSCSESLDIKLEPEVNVFLSHDREKKIRLTPEDKEYVALNEWLREHRSDWYPTSGRYPGGVYIKTGNYGIQITKLNVILYSTTHPEPRAMYVQNVSRGELSEIRNIGK